MDTEKLQHHIDHVTDKHRTTDRMIHQMELDLSFTDQELVALKKERLILKDEIARLTAQLELLESIKSSEDDIEWFRQKLSKARNLETAKKA